MKMNTPESIYLRRIHINEYYFTAKNSRWHKSVSARLKQILPKNHQTKQEEY